MLAAAFFLQLEDLCQLSLEISKSSISRENILDHVTFTHVPHPPAPAFFAAAPGPSKAAGAEESSRYGPYSKILAEAVSDFLVSELPSLLGAFGTRATAPQVAMTGEQANGFQLPAPSSGSTATQGAGTDELLQIYAQLDFTLFQHVIQSSELPVHSDQVGRLGSHAMMRSIRRVTKLTALSCLLHITQTQTQERFNFAKRCIAHRKKRFGTESGEETVVLAFGGKSASNVHGELGGGRRVVSLWFATAALLPSQALAARGLRGERLRGSLTPLASRIS